MGQTLRVQIVLLPKFERILDVRGTYDRYKSHGMLGLKWNQLLRHSENIVPSPVTTVLRTYV